MKKKLKYIVLGLENCQTMKFYSEDIERINIDNIKTSISINRGDATEYLTTNKFNIVLKPEANTYDSQVVTYFNNELPFDRIMKFNDICTIDLFYYDGSSAQYKVEWKQHKNAYIIDQENKNQTSHLSDNEMFGKGNLYIICDKKITAKQYLGLE